LGGEVGGEVGLSKLVSLSMKTTFGIASETSRQVNNSQNRTTGLNESSTTTDTESATESAGGGTGETFSWSVSSTETVSRDFGGVVIAGKFGVFYRQTLRLLRRGALVAY
ncbi:MAG: hypothetical protein GWO04_02005, partial [Actinobacteria bacterium]|nr:hypothetical protein [Actinomycetota bacterium]NIW26041.1 hypothetical protein [Actinomycetota bacterium]